MPLAIPLDLLAPDAREAWISVPVDATDPARGVVRVKLREIPKQEFGRLMGEYSAKEAEVARLLHQSRKKAEALSGELGESGARASVRGETSERLAVANEALMVVLEEIVARTVIDHRPEDCRVTDIPTGLAGEQRDRLAEVLSGLGLSASEIARALEEGATSVAHQKTSWTYKEKDQPGTGPLTLRYYRRADPTGAFFLRLLAFCIRFQNGQTPTPEDVWPKAQEEPPPDPTLPGESPG